METKDSGNEGFSKMRKHSTTRGVIITTGDELLKGEVVDTHAPWISDKLSDMGVEVVRHLTVGDDMDALKSQISHVAGTCEVVVVTGGLGPTEDDLTSEAVAAAARVPLEENAAAVTSIAAYFEERSVLVPASNMKQALLPQGARCILNPVGTAPGFYLELEGTHFWFLPGVPREMCYLMTRSVLPAISALLPGKARLVKTVITTFGLPESVVGERIAGIETSKDGVRIGYRAALPMIEVKIWVFVQDDDGLEQRQQAAVADALNRLEGYVVSSKGLSMAEAVAEKLCGASKTMAVAESCTGGLIASLLTDVPGSSSWFLLSAVTYANSAKEKVLGVSPEIIATCGAVSPETVKAMAEGVRRVSGADIGLSTSGIAGPTGGTPEKPVGTVWIGVSTPAGTEAHCFTSPFKARDQNKRIFAFKALNYLRKALDARR